MKIKIYTLPTCPYCHGTKGFLKSKGIKFENIDVSDNEDAVEEMVKKSGQNFVPVIDIDGEIIVGFDKEKIEVMLDAKNK